VRAAAWAVAVPFSVVLAACGGGHASNEPSAQAAATTTVAVPLSTTTTAAAVREQTVPVVKALWYAGFKVTVKSATLRTGRPEYGGAATPVLAILANFENAGPDRDRFDAETVLQSAGRNHFKTGDGQDVPEVPGGANQDGTIIIVVDPTFRFDDAVLVVGASDTNQSKVPLGKAGALVAHEPRAVPLTGRLSTVSLNIDLRGGELRADSQKYHRQVDAGELALKINYTSALSGCQFVNYQLTLVRPDGTTTDNVESGEGGKTDNFATFVVSERPAGAYTLKLSGEAKGSTGPGCPITFTAQTGFTIA
jgi:hypothetical protein